MSIKNGNRFDDRELVTVTLTIDKGALAALIDNPHMLQGDIEGAHWANAVRRGCKALKGAEVTERPRPVSLEDVLEALRTRPTAKNRAELQEGAAEYLERVFGGRS